MAKDEVHIQASRSWWSGRVTALCGRKFGEDYYQKDWLASVTCTKCRRIDKEGRR